MNNLFGILSRTHYSSNYLSFRLRKLFEKTSIRKAIGLQLTSTMFLAGVIIPQVELITSNVTANELTTTTEVAEPTQTEVTYQQPLDNYQLSQEYQFYHPGVDLRTSYNDPIMAIAKGKVEIATNSNWGYGRYIVLRHENDYTSLYAHLSKILVKEGDVVEKGTTIGNVGTTGWSTGSHLHLEIHGPEGSIDPLEVLPSIETAQN